MRFERMKLDTQEDRINRVNKAIKFELGKDNPDYDKVRRMWDSLPETEKRELNIELDAIGDRMFAFIIDESSMSKFSQTGPISFDTPAPNEIVD